MHTDCLVAYTCSMLTLNDSRIYGPCLWLMSAPCWACAGAGRELTSVCSPGSWNCWHVITALKTTRNACLRPAASRAQMRCTAWLTADPLSGQATALHRTICHRLTSMVKVTSHLHGTSQAASLDNRHWASDCIADRSPRRGMQIHEHLQPQDHGATHNRPHQPHLSRNNCYSPAARRIGPDRTPSPLHVSSEGQLPKP